MVNSYIVYILTIILSTIFAGLAQKYFRYNKNGKKTPHKLFWFMSMGILVFTMGFRDLSIGVDGRSYLNIYNNINSLGILEYYQHYIHEPGYVIFNKVIYLIFNDFQWIIILSSFFIIYGFYKAIEYEIENISLPLAVFIFATTQYYYYFGIIRLGMAVSIVVMAYRYIIENKKKKYILAVFLAAMFHYSALFALGLIFLTQSKKGIFHKINIIIISIIVPVAFSFVNFFIYPLIEVSKYQKYVQSSPEISFGFLPWFPFLILFLLHYNNFVRISKHYQFYFYLYVMRIVTEAFSPFIGTARMFWYVNLSICILLPATIRIYKNKYIKLFLLLITISFSIVYLYHAYLSLNSGRGHTMFPYLNILLFNS
ncbi:MAG: EpsG family protein [archaeon]